MLEGEASLTLDALNLATQAWVEQEYHRTKHSEIGATPLEHYLAGPNVRRECPATVALTAAFRVEVIRRQRRSDGTVSLEVARFEIPSRYRLLERVHLQYARRDLSQVDPPAASCAQSSRSINRPMSTVSGGVWHRRRSICRHCRQKACPPLTKLPAEYAATGARLTAHRR